MNNEVQDIKDRVHIEDLVGQYVQLKKTGSTLKGLCPFHSEKSPSFVVSPERGIAYCFGCNKGGDIFTFFQEMEGVDFGGAVKALAERAGVKLAEYRKGTGEDTFRASGDSRADQKEQIYAAHEQATALYEENLWNTANGTKVLEYLRKRGLTDESIKLWRLGFAPESFDTLNNYLLQKGFTKKLLVEAGLAMSKETTMEKIYDRFRGRLMFPIWNGFGKIVAFGGRALAKDQDPKYLNSPESAIYHKSSVLYGFFQCKQGIKQAGEAVLVEGYMDVIAAFQAGISNVAAPCGTALASKQLRLLKPFASCVALAFDMDMAGQEAAKRAYDTARDSDIAVKVVTLPDGKDPAEFAQTHGAGELADIMKAGVPYVDFFYQRLLDMYGTGDLSAKKTVLREFLPFLHQLGSAVERDEYVRRLCYDLDIKEQHVYDEIRNFKLPRYSAARAGGQFGIDDESGESALHQRKRRTGEELLLGLMIEFPRMGKLFLEKVDEESFSDTLKPIYKAFCQQYNGDGPGPDEDFISSLPHDIKESAALLSLYIAETYEEMSEEAVEKELTALCSRLKKDRLKVEQHRLQKALSAAEKDGDMAVKLDLLDQLNKLHTQLTV